MRFRLPEVSVLRELDHAAIDRILDHRIEHRRETSERWARQATRGKTGMPLSTVQIGRWRNITDGMRADLHTVAQFLLDAQVDYKLVISVDRAWIYTNSVDLVAALSTCPVTAQKYTRATIARAKNTIVLRNPRHTHRSYLRSGKITHSEKDSLTAFLENHRDEIRMSPALIEWTQESYLRIYEYFFIDHDGPYWLTMLGLVHPGLVKKTHAIISAK